MDDTTLLGPWVRRFLLEHLIGERNLSRQTQLSYRDTLRILLPFVADQCHQSLDQLTVEQVSAARVLCFLHYVEEVRHCTYSYTQSTSSRYSRFNQLHRCLQSRAYRLVR